MPTEEVKDTILVCNRDWERGKLAFFDNIMRCALYLDLHIISFNAPTI